MNRLREGRVFYDGEPAGTITETDEGYIFEYDGEFLKKELPLSASLPPRKEAYKSRELFPFFRGLLPEGWYLEIVSAKEKIDKADLFGLLLCTAAKDTIGAVTVKRAER